MADCRDIDNVPVLCVITPVSKYKCQSDRVKACLECLRSIFNFQKTNHQTCVVKGQRSTCIYFIMKTVYLKTLVLFDVQRLSQFDILKCTYDLQTKHPVTLQTFLFDILPTKCFKRQLLLFYFNVRLRSNVSTITSLSSMVVNFQSS